MVTEENMGWLRLGHRYKPFGAVLPTAPRTDTKDKTKEFYIPSRYHPSVRGAQAAMTCHPIPVKQKSLK